VRWLFLGTPVCRNQWGVQACISVYRASTIIISTQRKTNMAANVSPRPRARTRTQEHTPHNTDVHKTYIVTCTLSSAHPRYRQVHFTSSALIRQTRTCCRCLHTTKTTPILFSAPTLTNRRAGQEGSQAEDVCACTCMFIGIGVCGMLTRVCVYAYAMRVCMCVYTHARVYMQVFVYVCTHVHVHAYIYIQRMYIYIYMYMHARAHPHTHTNKHVRTCICSCICN